MLASVKGARARKIHFDSCTDGPRAAILPALVRPEGAGLSPRIAAYLKTAQLPSPCLIVDVDQVATNYTDLASALPEAQVYYAVKANPADEILARLSALGSSFDTASLGEIDLCLRHGVDPARISFGNTIKKQRDIAAAYERGVRLFAFDSEAELLKLAEAAPGSRVFCRILVDCEGAEWPLSRKFGCEPEMAIELLARARDLGLDPCGISFHVGSQQTRLEQFDRAIGQAQGLFRELAARGIDLRMINVGGGFPSRYRTDVPPIRSYADTIRKALARHFPGKRLEWDSKSLKVGNNEAANAFIKRKQYRSGWEYSADSI